MNGLTREKKLRLFVLCVLCVLCLSSCAQHINIKKEVINGSRFDDEFEITFLDGPIPISLATPSENGISMEQALQIAQEVVHQDKPALKKLLSQCLRNVNFVTLGNVSESYHIGGWVVTYFLTNSYEDSHAVIIDGTSGSVLLSLRGGRSGTSWTVDDTHGISFGGQNFRFSVEWAAVYDTVFGLPGDTHFRHVLPTENDISQEEALEIAKAHVQKRFGTSEEEVESYFVDFMFISGWQYNDQERTADTIWSVGFYSAGLDEWGYWIPICGVEISSADGKVIGVSMPGA